MEKYHDSFVLSNCIFSHQELSVYTHSKVGLVTVAAGGNIYCGGGLSVGGGGQTNWSQTQQKQHNTQYANPVAFIKLLSNAKHAAKM